MKKGELASDYWSYYDGTDVEIADTVQVEYDMWEMMVFCVTRLSNGDVIWSNCNGSCIIDNYAERDIIWPDYDEPCYDDGTPIDWGEEF